MAPAIPDRWLDYTPVGQPIRGTRFIAFKVPLREHVVASVPSKIRLSCESLLEKIPNLGMIIDLTNTTRYYDPYHFEKEGVFYKKIMIPGRQIPPKNCVQNFAMAANNFLQENANNGKLIGVHCTHGVNRTGYLIASYMISDLQINPKTAIKRVEEARGHAIERENYKEHLLGVEAAPSSSYQTQTHHNNNSSKLENWRDDNWRHDHSQSYSNNKRKLPYSYRSRQNYQHDHHNERSEEPKRSRIISHGEEIQSWRRNSNN